MTSSKLFGLSQSQVKQKKGAGSQKKYNAFCFYCAFLLLLGGTNPSFAGIESLGIFPDGTGNLPLITDDPSVPYLRCYKDDALEAGRPYVHPALGTWEIALADEEIKAAAFAAADSELNIAKAAYEATVQLVHVDTRPDPRDTLAGFFKFSLAEDAKDKTEETYQTAVTLFGLPGEKTFDDLNPFPIIEKYVVLKWEQTFGDYEADPRFSLINPTTKPGLVIDIYLQQQVLVTLGALRDAALVYWTSLQATIPDDTLVAVGDPKLKTVYEAKLAIWQLAEEAKNEAERISFLAHVAEINAVSSLPPCDSNELRQALNQAFCSDEYVNPFTPEDEVQFPGITARFESLKNGVCAAVASDFAVMFMLINGFSEEN